MPVSSRAGFQPGESLGAFLLSGKKIHVLKKMFTKTELKIVIFLVISALTGFIINVIIKPSKDPITVVSAGVSECDTLKKTTATTEKETRTKQTADPAAEDRRIDLNRADRAMLESIKGIGPKTAAAIIKYRERFGGFKKLDDLEKVKGIGPKKLKKISPFLEIKQDSIK
jgi:comEA protein